MLENLAKMNWNKIILQRLISIYERRFFRSSELKQIIKININEKELKEYFDYNYALDIKDSIDYLEKQQFIMKHYFKNSSVLKAISLNVSKVNDIYHILESTTPYTKFENLKEALNSYSNDIIEDFKRRIEEKIIKKESMRTYCENIEDFTDAIKCVYYIEKLDIEISQRNFSNKIFQDSKRFESLKPIILDIYNEHDDDFFITKGIIKNPSYIYIKGEGVIKIQDEMIDLKKMKHSIGISSLSLDHLSFENIKKVTTIENLTTFYDYVEDGLVIYLGGFSSFNKNKLIGVLKRHCKNFYHFGDIDYGGFSILNDLMKKNNISIKTIYMDIKTIKGNIESCQRIDDSNYINKLKTLLLEENLKMHHETIQFLIDNKIRLEQEAIYNK